MNTTNLKLQTEQIRKRLLEVAYRAKAGHIGVDAKLMLHTRLLVVIIKNEFFFVCSRR
jgi:hypothetical protein